MNLFRTKSLSPSTTPDVHINQKVIILISVLMAMIICLFANSNGLGMTHDSIQYWEKSIIFKNTWSLRKAGFTTFLPFQSLEVVLLSILGANALTIMKYLHVLFLGGTVFIHLTIAKEIFKHTKTLIIYALTLVFSTPLLMVHSFLWTEPLFIVLVSLQWYMLWRFFQRKTSKVLVAILLISVIYCWQRKAGMLFSLGLIVVFIAHFASSKKKLAGILVAISLAIFILYGGLGTTNFIGEHPALSSIPLNLKNYFGALGGWIFPLPLNYWIRTGLFVFLLVVIALVLKKTLPEMEERRKSYIRGIIIIILTYVVIRHFYPRPHADEADRFLAPIYPGMFFLIIFVWECVLLKTRKAAFRLILPVILALWLIYPVIRTFKNAKQWHNRTKIPLLIKKEIQPMHKK